jgi:hypothetical protein
VVPNANVTATAIATGTSTSVLTNAEGFYVIPNLRAAAYLLHVAAAGFQAYEQTGITLQVGQATSVNVSLKVGSASAKVTVTGAAPLVNIRQQTVSYAVTPQFAEQLPLNGRNIIQLITLAPDGADHNANAATMDNQSSSRPEAAAGFVTSSGGSRDSSGAFYLDGGLNEDVYTNVVQVYPNPDAIQEFTFETNSYSAKYSGWGGGIVNAVTKGGTNSVHGSAFEYVRNGDLNARNPFALTQDTLKRNQFGFSLGAPIQKNKTFGFLSYQRTTLREASTAGSWLGPTPAELGKNADGTPHYCPGSTTQVCGDWSAISTQLVNPLNLTTQYPNGVPFTNNQVPISLYSSISMGIVAQVPAAGSNGQIHSSVPILADDNQWVARVDRNFGDKFRLGTVFFADKLVSPRIVDPKNILTNGYGLQWANYHPALNITYTFGPNLVTTLNGTLARVAENLLPPQGAAFQTPIQRGAHWPVLGSPTSNAALLINDWNWYLNWPLLMYQPKNQLDLSNNWTYARGNHTLEMGGEFVDSQFRSLVPYGSGGAENFICANSGSSPLDFLLGSNCSFTINGLIYEDPRGRKWAAYFSDDWKVSRRLTLNLGVRWEPWEPWSDTSTTRLGMIFSPQLFAQGVRSTMYPNLPKGILVQGDPGVPRSMIKADWKLFDPRVGFAWDVAGDGKTSVRGGFGIYQDQEAGRFLATWQRSFPFNQSYTITDHTVSAWSPFDAAPYNGVLPNAAQVSTPVPSNFVFPSPFGYTFAIDPSFQAPDILQWNLTLERQLGAGVMVHGGYEGSFDYHMFDGRDINAGVYIAPGQCGLPDPTAACSTVGNLAQRRPYYPYYNSSIAFEQSAGTARYNALVLSVEKRMTRNLSFLGGYRWARCTDVGSTASMGQDEHTDSTNRLLDKGPCDSDLTSQFKMAVNYVLPTPTQWGFAGRHVLGGWSTSAFWVQRSGFPFSVLSGVDTNRDGNNSVGSADRANLVGNASLMTPHTVAQWFNPAAFAVPAFGSNGNSGRNILIGPGFSNVDFSVAKSFPIRKGPAADTMHLDFRAEFFNFFNHPNWAQPVNNLSSPQVGQITSTYGGISGGYNSFSIATYGARVIQFALKLYF